MIEVNCKQFVNGSVHDEFNQALVLVFGFRVSFYGDIACVLTSIITKLKNENLQIIYMTRN